MKSQQLKFGILMAVIAMLLGAWLAHLVTGMRNAPPALQTGTVITPPRDVPAFTLQDTHGKPVTLMSLANHWSILFFGYTSCPDVCPTTLSQLAAAHKLLADLPAQQQPQIIFISVDPRRDTIAKLAGYLNYFSKDFLGFTGTQEQINAFTSAMGVPVGYETQPDGSYTVDHAATLFAINPQQQLVAVFSPPYQAAALAKDLRILVTH
ncbi:MAG TPA: SCO family protein [Steroidobacteraceae bacterium]|nr:SCO family protein [Steroidobacteraceae bacterium]